MQGIKKSIQSYFNFSKREFNGILLLIALILMTLSFPVIYRYYNVKPAYKMEVFETEIREYEEQIKLSGSIQSGKRSVKAEYFVFDPNGLDEKSWRKLGLSDKQIKVIYNFEAKGGKFYNKEDFKKMYSISTEQYLLLEPFIRIVNKSSPAKQNVRMSLSQSNPLRRNAKKVLVEINSADSAMLTEIHGIGPAFASRIIKYRDRLGGFYKMEQLKEVYGIDSVKYEQIKDQISLNSGMIIQISINSATFEILRKHPYLSYKQMNAILQYRRQHGNFKTAEELKKVAILNEEIIRKIEPYISFNP